MSGPLTPSQKRKKLDESEGKLSELEARAFLIDRLSPDAFHSLETAETADEKAESMHAALMELIGGRNR